MTEAELRLECLKLALQHCGFGDSRETAVYWARKFSDFVLNQSDSEIIAAAKVQEKAVKSQASWQGL